MKQDIIDLVEAYVQASSDFQNAFDCADSSKEVAEYELKLFKAKDAFYKYLEKNL